MKMKIKKMLSIILTALVCFALLTACDDLFGDGASTTPATTPATSATTPATLGTKPVFSRPATTVQSTAQIPQVMVWITETGERYHLSSCRHLSSSSLEVTLEHALEQGLTPCATCSPNN